MGEKVTMQSPDGSERREVDANGPELVPLMVQGWTQAHLAANSADPGTAGVSEVK